MKRSIRVKVKAVFDGIVYRYAIVNKIFRTLNKGLSRFTAFRVRPFGTLTVKLNSGIGFKLATNETSTVTKRLFWEGADRYEYTGVFEKLVKKCHAFADIGANLGYYSLLAVKSNPAIRVYAFEPARAPYTFLSRNLIINQAQGQIEAFALALSNQSGKIPFHELQATDQGYHPFNLGGTGKILNNDTAGVEPVWVPSETFDNFFVGKSPLPDLIKIDTEGTENLILSGAGENLRKHKPIIICETLFNVIERELEEIMKQHGYHFYNFVNGRLLQTDRLVRSKDNGVRDCFFVHPQKRSLVDEFIR